MCMHKKMCGRRNGSHSSSSNTKSDGDSNSSCIYLTQALTFQLAPCFTRDDTMRTKTLYKNLIGI